jgi:hypothetical protein
MFVTRKTLDWLLDQRDRDVKAIEDRYWKLWHKHNNLLLHLGLNEVEVPARTELRTKGSPERGE